MNPLHSFCIYSHHPSYSSMKPSPQAVVSSTLSYSNSCPKHPPLTPLSSTALSWSPILDTVGHYFSLKQFQPSHHLFWPFLSQIAKLLRTFTSYGSSSCSWSLAIRMPQVPPWKPFLMPFLFCFFLISSFYFILFFPDTFYCWYVLLILSNCRFILLSLLFVFFFLLRRGLPG